MKSLHHWFIRSTHASKIVFFHRPGKQHVYVQYQKQTMQKMLQNFEFYLKFLNDLYCISCAIFQKLKLTTIKPSQDFHSTTTLLLKFSDDIKRAMNTSEATLGILLDYSKAFDTIDHLTSLEKLHKRTKAVCSTCLIKVHPSNLTTLVCHRVAFQALCSSTYTFHSNMLMIPSCTNIQNRKI